MLAHKATFDWDGLTSALRERRSLFAKAGAVVVVDSHTEGEPTRLVVGGAPDLGAGTAAERGAAMRADFDSVRRLLVNEPRGNPATVGVVLARPQHPEALTQAIYFNNVGYLTMCVHATIGLVHTLARTVGLPQGAHRIETPAGLVQATVEADGSVSVENVASYRLYAGVEVETQRHGLVRGDVAYGGNWFFVVSDPEQAIGPSALGRLADFATDVRNALLRHGVVGRGGAQVDHVYVTGPASSSDLDQRNYVLCPGGAHDRSPCGTGTSANLACLAADGRLKPGVTWNQESCIGTRFAARFHHDAAGAVVPTINGRAYLTGEAALVLEADGPFPDPFPEGIPSFGDKT